MVRGKINLNPALEALDLMPTQCGRLESILSCHHLPTTKVLFFFVAMLDFSLPYAQTLPQFQFRFGFLQLKKLQTELFPWCLTLTRALKSVPSHGCVTLRCGSTSSDVCVCVLHREWHCHGNERPSILQVSVWAGVFAEEMQKKRRTN